MLQIVRLGKELIISTPNPSQFVSAWALAWNSHDVDAVLAHFAEDAVFTSPIAARLIASSDGRLHGKAEIRSYWRNALALIPDLHFTIEGVYAGVDTIVIAYRNQKGNAVSEVLTFKAGLVIQGHGTYQESDQNPAGTVDR
jgi:ketosteroid isomerase-like protein